jgi:hypothetical protein
MLRGTVVYRVGMVTTFRGILFALGLFALLTLSIAVKISSVNQKVIFHVTTLASLDVRNKAEAVQIHLDAVQRQCLNVLSDLNVHPPIILTVIALLVPHIIVNHLMHYAKTRRKKSVQRITIANLIIVAQAASLRQTMFV